jgi:hypothetical protein
VLELRRALKDVLAGAVFVVLGLAFAIGALAYNIGTPLRMGPGYMPLALGIVLVGLGLAVVVKGFLAGEGESIGGLEWRALILITAAVIFFGVTVRGFGLAIALFGAVLLGALGRSRTTPLEAVLIAAGLTVLSIAVFVWALQLRLPLTGPWLPF